VHRSRLRRVLAATALLALLASAAAATTVRPLTAEQVDSLADRVFEGTCVEVRVVEPSDVPFPVTESVFVVERVIKGDALAQQVAAGHARLTVRQAGGTGPSGHVWIIPGMPAYEVGARYRLALNGDSAWGLTSPVGLGQGVARLGAPEKGAQP